MKKELKNPKMITLRNAAEGLALNPQSASKGFTFPEILIVTGILTTLFAIATVSLFSIRTRTSINSSVNKIIYDLKRQQAKAMNGDTEGRSFNSAYGVFFGTLNYTLFHDTYSPTYDNLVVDLDGLQFSNVTIPNSQILFATHSGEIVNFTPGSNSFNITGQGSGEVKTILLNRYGVIIGVN